MRDNLPGAVWRLTVFLVVCAFGFFALVATFAQLRFDDVRSYNAVFSNVTGLIAGDFVRVAGVEVGKVKDIRITDDATALVVFTTDRSVVLTRGTKAAIRYDNLIGGRFLSLEEGAGGTQTLPAGATIGLSNTAPALDLDALIGGFRPLFRALDPNQVNALTGELIDAFQGQGATVNSFFTQVAALTNTLADRDKLIGAVVVNLNTVLGSLGDRSDKFAEAVDSLSQLVSTLAERKQDLSNAVAYGNAGAASLADLLGQARPPLKTVVGQTDRVASIAVADHDYLDDFFKTLPDAYQLLSRLGLYGDYFSFYLCDLALKVNGKGGQPVYIKIASQPSGRCTPK